MSVQICLCDRGLYHHYKSELFSKYFKIKINAKIIKEREKFLTTGCPKFDTLLQGGITTRGITQIYGAASTGKTQLALQLCLTVQLPTTEGGFAAGAVYICTECTFPSRRLQELIQKLEITKKYGINGDSVFVEHISTIEELEICLLHRIPILMSVQKIGLIIIDSIAAPYRVEDWKDESNKRGKSLRTIGQQLHKLCKNDICVVCINQVTAIMRGNISSDYLSVRPSLGITWLSMITNSIQFYRIGTMRYACVKLSSNLSETTISFEIQGYGVKAID
ncbi:DNA repair protein XRCC3-like isoform X2 [Bombus vosnesenskii]|uniref:DNA repair protein XRCC3-like isoform X2 n=1 Tax=Bombus vosnesenskii TaxID=207650 RepID=A0A6J3KER3_9HYME|nr:DNA repair protein XRCC3-like isoform X2 [Bombus vosnesenskii]